MTKEKRASHVAEGEGEGEGSVARLRAGGECVQLRLRLHEHLTLHSPAACVCHGWALQGGWE